MNLIKSALLISALFIAAMSNISKADNHHSSYSFNKLQTSLCFQAKENKVAQFRIQLREARTHIRAIYSQVTCQGESLIEVAKNNNSENIVNYLNIKTRGLEAMPMNSLAVK